FDGSILQVETAEGVQSVEADTVILAVGYTSENELYEQLRDEVPEIHLLGDARRVANIMYAIWDAYEVASHIE
ncbi:MAG TPA: 2-enoate reductase, partial [Clostridia bacterium]|nr:2-enoate reductase [Clostridia bacterium]